MGMKPCKECGKEVSTSAKNCPNCGKPSPAGSLLPGKVFGLEVFSRGMKPCKECGKEVSASAKKCPNCGKPHPTNNLDLIAKVFGLSLVVLFVFAIVGNEDPKTTPQATRAFPDATPQATPARPAVDATISFASMRQQMRGNLTEAQFKAVARGLEGRRIRWRGWVEDVNEKMFGGYELWVDMDSPNVTISVQDVTFDIPDNLALSLRKDAPVRFEGTIRSVTNVMGSLSVRLTDAVVLQ